MPPRRALVARTTPSARTANNPARNASATTDEPISAAAINQLIETRVAEVLANQEQLRNNSVTGDGVIGLTQWFEKMESVFHISNCTIENQVKFATCTLLGATLTWWNSHIKTVGHDAAYGMPWKTLMKMMTVKYCPRRGCFLRNLMKWRSMSADFPDMIQGIVMSARPKTMQESIKLANDLMDQKNVVQAYTIGSSEKKEYAGTFPLCNKCKFHHHGPCTVKCTNCKKVGHLTRDCWNPTTANNQRTITCYECGNQGHYKSDWPELRNQNHGNQAEDTKAHEWCMLWE
ncbi:putative reverse transcriptase domain-containing protein [Tanacetum coccineum]